ncbi:hypothetical protein CB0940_08333 [Cercospora beticola]|uniref:RING-type domain-containing protein n=1 Tax=Cercospora beticola TaxID=122368 RepID=A0A2G5HPE9_CERBT|nr:hypothetical protein CB0940_08333 [Cercospora beticola]PIA94437.1 hypothetical protein CB0940_08333 [Cercospora beticola]WPB04905.1 hypothetical protein RHO25_009553 [Cercospora beticola]CAK1364673.1 unnamed protein product [Cercospora beticola]
MGTLTAGVPRLAQHCEHKLPTSCMLWDAHCCACIDERPHSTSYRTYIDGVGFVARGLRWQRYCSSCRAYWDHRIAACGLRPDETRIPERPDQGDFLARWYEFYQGYRLVSKDDGSEERVAVLGEPLREVSPGVLPRTLEELREGRERSEMEERERAEAIRQRQERDSVQQEAPAGPSLEETLDQLFQAASVEEANTAQSAPSPAHRVEQHREPHAAPLQHVHGQAMVPAGTRNREYQARRIAALRRELHRMRSGIERVISGLRDLGEDVPDHGEASDRLSDLGRTLDNIAGSAPQDVANRALASVNALTEGTATTQTDRAFASLQARVDEARQHVDEARRSRDQAATELDVAERDLRSSQSRLRQLQSEQRTTENYTRIFGTREEMAAQGEQYQSPIGGMFERAYERFRTAEDVRREERTLRQVLADEERAGGEDVASRLAELEARERDVWGVPHPPGSQQDRGILRQITITHDRNSTSQAITSSSQPIRESESGLEPRGEEVALEQYYSLLRRQGWNSEARAAEPVELEAPSNEVPGDLPELPADTTTITIVGGPPGESLDPEPHVNNDRGLDGIFILTALSNNESLRSNLLGNPTVSYIEHLLGQVRGNSLSHSDRETIEGYLEDSNVIWGSGLPAERLRRRRQRGETVSFNEMAHEIAASGTIIVHDVELMAGAFQTSSHIRRRSGTTLSEQLRMLYRLQRGERTSEDRAVLVRMLQNESTFARAKHVVEEQSIPSAASGNAAELDRERQQAAREGDHSRTELDAQRRATQTLALAAGRVAMQATPAELIERMANRDEATRAAYERLQANGFAPTAMGGAQPYRPLSIDDFIGGRSDSDTDSDDEAKGLDARNTGRPTEPLAEEDLNVRLDCQVCYTQLADIACLPCGHLVMCQWCSDQHSPTMPHDRTRPRRAAACPVCRKQIRQKVRVFRP